MPVNTKPPPHIYPVPREIHERSPTVATPSVFDGIAGPDSCAGCFPRRNIEDLQKNHADVFNMFILALEALQKDPESSDTSYYQIAGIHGRPHIKWQQVIPPEQANPQLGYCTHRARIFNTWHRPYLSLLEVIMSAQ